MKGYFGVAVKQERMRRWRRASRPLAAAAVLLLLGLVLLFGWVDWAGLAGWGRPRAPWLAAFAAAAALTAAGARAIWPASDDRARERAPGLSWWTVLAAAMVVGTVAWGATSWLLAEADRASTADAKAAAKVDAIKTGLGIGAGTTGIFALLLAVRRQTHQERTAADTIHDATERRVTELYTKAADQLGSPKAAVRLAGLYALERLGDDHESQRQTIANVICAYLRMRYTEPVEPDDKTSSEKLDRYEDRLQEAQTRATAQRILHRHHNTIAKGLLGSIWDVELDLGDANLAGASLAWANFAGTNLRGVDFTRADLRFADLQQADLPSARLTDANLSGAQLLGAQLQNAVLAGADLSGANLTSADLYQADLTGASLIDARLVYANLEGANLEGAILRDTLLDDARVNPKTRIDLPFEYEIREWIIRRIPPPSGFGCSSDDS